MFCCSPKPKDLIGKIDECLLHQEPNKFVCTDPNCNEQPLLCTECLVDHREHKWFKLKQFLTPELQELIKSGKTETQVRLQQSNGVMVAKIENFYKHISERIEKLRTLLLDRWSKLNKKYVMSVDIESIQHLTNPVMGEIVRIYSNEQSSAWIPSMTTFFTKVLDESQDSIINVLADVENLVNTEKWEGREEQENEGVYNQFVNHIHNHQEEDPQFYRWEPSLKHANIKLKEGNLEAEFHRNVPSKPAIMANNFVNPHNLRFGIEVVKLETQVIFFAKTTVFVGVAQSRIVKAVGLRRINEASKGAYMIGSTGWSYHHKNVDYDRKDNVGWGFGQGDKVEVEVDLEVPGKITFSKEGKIFKNTFSMPLDLTAVELKALRPVLSFDADEGAEVKLYNIPN